MSKKAIIVPEILGLYEKLVGTRPGVGRKVKTMPYTSVNGHMFSFLSPDGIMGLRLAEADRKEFIRKFDSKLMEQYGKIMKEYAEVPAALLKDTETLAAYFAKSYSYVSRLEPEKTANE